MLGKFAVDDPTPITRGDMAVIRNELLLPVQAIMDGTLRNQSQFLVGQLSLMHTGTEARLSAKMEEVLDVVSHNTSHP